MVPEEPAGSKVWQLPQPFEANTCLPAAASPSTASLSPPPVSVSPGVGLRCSRVDALSRRRLLLAAAAADEQERKQRNQEEAAHEARCYPAEPSD